MPSAELRALTRNAAQLTFESFEASRLRLLGVIGFGPVDIY